MNTKTASLLLGALLPACMTFAAPGDLDVTFSGDGRVISSFGLADSPADTLVQPDGKVVVVGLNRVPPAAGKIVIARYTAAGALDTSFGTGGRTITTVSGGNTTAAGVARQADGKLVVCGQADANGEDFCVLRYNVNGTLDTTFGGGDGIVTTDFGADSGAEAVAVAPVSGKIIVVGNKGFGNGQDMAVACYDSTGALDTSFNSTGMLTVPVGSGENGAEDVAVLVDGSILVTGTSYMGVVNDHDITLAKITPAGVLDTSFDTDGIALTHISGADRGLSLCVQQDGDIVVVGRSVNNAAVVRYDGATGTLDTDFSGDGKLTKTVSGVPSVTTCDAVGVGVEAGGRIVVAAYSRYNSGANVVGATFRFEPDGTADSTFGTSGTVVETLGLDPGTFYGFQPVALAVQGNGRIIVAGAAEDASADDQFAVVRYVGTPVPRVSVEQPVGTYLSDGTSTVDYGQMLPSTTPVTKTFTIRSAGALPLALDGPPVTITGPDAVEFMVSALTPATSPMPVGTSATFTVKFTPFTAGVKTATLRVLTDDPTQDPFDIALTANVSHPVKLGNTGYAVEEGSAATIDLVRQTAGGVVTVEIKSANGTALLSNNDYTQLNQLVTFANGDTVKTVQLQTTDDSTQEAIETLTVTISGGTAVKVAPLSATVRIIDDSAQQQGAGAGEDNAVPPAPGITSPGVNALMPVATGQPMTVTGTATDGKSVEKVEVSFDNVTFTPAVLAMPGAASTAYTGTVTPVGDPALGYKVYVKTTDYSGRVSATTERTFRVARNLPVELYTELFTPGTGMVPSILQKGSVTAGFAPSSFREPGTLHTITATPVAGHVFDGWEVSGTSPLAGTPDFSQEANWGLIEVTEASLELSKLTFRMREGLQLKARFRDNPFTTVAGIYNGLVTSDDAQPDNGPAPDGTTPANSTEGFFTATVLATGGFSGKLFIDGLELPVAGAFDNDGVARFGTTRATDVRVARPGKPYLEVYLTLGGMDDTDAQNDVISGGVSQKLRNEVVAVSGVRATRNFYNAAGPATWVPGQFLGPLSIPGGVPADQTYTVLLQAMDILDQPAGVFTSESEFPTGHGYASMKLTRGGAVTMAGKLPDGTPLSYSGFATSDAGTVSVPFYVSLYGKTGCITGPLVLATPANDWEPELTQLQYNPNPAYPVLWFRPYQDAQHYQYGWPEGLRMTMVGGKYTVPPSTPAPGSSVLPDVTNGDRAATVKFSGGLLAVSPLTEAIEVSPTEVITELPLDPVFSLTITRATGVISGNFKHSDGTTQPYYGVIYQKGEFPADRGGFGFFMSQTPAVKDYLGEGGQVLLQATP